MIESTVESVLLGLNFKQSGGEELEGSELTQTDCSSPLLEASSFISCY